MGRQDPSARPLAPIGGDERTRTADPLVANQVLYQLSYVPGNDSKQRELPTSTDLPHYRRERLWRFRTQRMSVRQLSSV